MKNQKLDTGQGGSPPNDKDIRKLSALVLLKKALDGEKFEDCAELVKKARQQGVNSKDILQVIDQSLKGITEIKRPQKQSKKSPNLRRF